MSWIQQAVSLTLPCLALAAAPLSGPAIADAADDYRAGYATAIVERDLGLEVTRIEVSGNAARVFVRDLADVLPQRVADAVESVDGIDRVAVYAGDGPEPAATADAEPGDGHGLDRFQFLPRKELFEPLLADPRQPRFSASYLWYLDDPELTHVGSANFGETFALMGGALDEDTRWEIGLLGAVFSIFDLDASSYDLINSDFWVAPTFSLRRDGLSAQLRLYHQSSHLGDEFLLRDRVDDRVNLSYEGVDLLVSADVHPAMRVYLGGGVIVHDEPDLDPLSGQVGVELRSPRAFLEGVVRPLVAADFQFREENDWKGEYSAVAGIQIENPDISPLELRILFEYFRGNSPNGQFFDRRIEYMGVGTHLHF